MSGQWEIVKAKNDRRSKVPVPKANNKQPDGKAKKTNILNGIQLEDVLPKSQMQNLYSVKTSASKDTKPAAKTKQKGEKKPNKSSPEPPKPKLPKSIEAALLAISPEQFSIEYEESKRSFPDAPIIWLKQLTHFLNQKIPLDVKNPVFSNKPSGFPLNMPSALRATIEKAVTAAGKSNAQLYFNIALTSLVTDLSKGLATMGYRFFLQYIALNEPKLVTETLAKCVALRNSYQNRSNIALSILWAVGHVGVHDLQSGLKVFEELMLPLLDMKSYTHYVVQYLVELTSRSYKTPLTKEQCFLILSVVHSKAKHFPADLQKKLVENLPTVRDWVMNNSGSNLKSWVEPFLKKIASTPNQAYQNSLCYILMAIFVNNDTTLNEWLRLYSKNLPASTVLFDYIPDNYDSLPPPLKENLITLLHDCERINRELALKSRKDDGLKEAIRAMKRAQERKQTPVKTSGFGRKLLSSLLIVALIAILAEPFYRLSKPQDELCLFQIGRKLADGVLWIDSRLDQIIPKVYYGKAKEVLSPYGALACDTLKVSSNVLQSSRNALADFVDTKYPLLVASIESYAPGLIDNTQVIFTDAFAKTINYYHISKNYLQNEVFVGQLSPENIQRVVVGAYNTTSEKAIEYYHWVYQKVQTSIK
ncbi:hypothetical protein HUJ04_013100 [Dendroctonus ponderosae]|nr:hypothetical protein HUJ04_013100 [Dendroctonus ponderosae]KAH1006614.1 hypothetical protein HUJ05_007327 [Dendroctonus ponderosae]